LVHIPPHSDRLEGCRCRLLVLHRYLRLSVHVFPAGNEEGHTRAQVLEIGQRGTILIEDFSVAEENCGTWRPLHPYLTPATTQAGFNRLYGRCGVYLMVWPKSKMCVSVTGEV